MRESVNKQKLYKSAQDQGLRLTDQKAEKSRPGVKPKRGRRSILDLNERGAVLMDQSVPRRTVDAGCGGEQPPPVFKENGDHVGRDRRFLAVGEIEQDAHQYSSASMMVSTRVVFDASAGSSEPNVIVEL